MRKLIITLVALFSVVASTEALSQGAEPQANQQQSAQTPAQPNTQPEKKIRQFNSDTFPSLLFTYWEQMVLEDARRSRGINRAPTEQELEKDLDEEEDFLLPKPPPEKRNIALNGIAYNDAKSWTIWLNGQRVTPKAIPSEVLDLKVFKEYIELKWYDEYTNRIIPIRLRTHQRFNIDTRIFLPG